MGGHRTFAPRFLGSGGATPGGNTPSMEGLILWLKGDVGVTTSVGNPNLATAWADQSGFNQDFNTDEGFEPNTGLESINGINCISMPASSTAYMQRFGTGLLDRNGNQMGLGAAETNTFSVLAVFAIGETNFDFFGGVLLHFNGADGSPVQTMFDMEHTNRPDGLWLFSNGWRDYGVSNHGPDTAPSVYDGIPTMVQCSSTAFPNVDVKVNNVDTTLSPLTQQGSQFGATTPLAMVGNSLRTGFGLGFVLKIGEILAYDHHLPSSPAAQAQTVSYLQGRFGL